MPSISLRSRKTKIIKKLANHVNFFCVSMVVREFAGETLNESTHKTGNGWSAISTDKNSRSPQRLCVRVSTCCEAVLFRAQRCLGADVFAALL